MPVRLHPSVYDDLSEIMDYYASVAGNALALAFYREFRRCIKVLGSRPQSFRTEKHGLRRCNLNRFPHHILFDFETTRGIFVLVVKHDHRSPDLGTDRR